MPRVFEQHYIELVNEIMESTPPFMGQKFKQLMQDLLKLKNVTMRRQRMTPTKTVLAFALMELRKKGLYEDLIVEDQWIDPSINGIESCLEALEQL